MFVYAFRIIIRLDLFYRMNVCMSLFCVRETDSFFFTEAGTLLLEEGDTDVSDKTCYTYT